MDEISLDRILIDRLVLDIPGLTPGQARALGRQIGKGLAATSAAVPHGGASFDALAVDLNDLPSNTTIPRLAEAIVSALLIQIGGR
jgi:hypothetical protein